MPVLRAMIEHTRANPQRLKLELTESCLIDNFELIAAKMHTLRADGIRFSLGYLFARPLPVAAFEALVRQKY